MSYGLARLAGFVVTISILLSAYWGTFDITTPSFLWLALFTGLNLIQYSFTGFCPANKLFGKKSDA